MSRNGSGTYTLPAGNPVVTGTTISSTWANNTLTDIATALTGSLAADGQTTATGNLKMGNNRVTGLADGIASTDGATVSQVAASVAGLGTMSAQNANAVAVTGGAVDGTAVGTTTRSTVKATTLDLGLSTQSVAIGQGNASIMKNRIINGAMVIDQRNAGASVTPASFAYTLDRWQAVQTTASKFSVQQNAGAVTPPAGFNSYLGVTSLSAYSVAAGDTFNILQSVEGFNCSDFAWGTASAKTVTLSFWVRSSLTGTFGGAIKDGSSTNSYPFSYTISAANTWEQKSVTIVGPTAGQFSYTSTTNGIGLQVAFGLGAGATFSGTAGAWAAVNAYTATGATSVVGTNGATFYITGVQLEVGSSATGYEYRQYGTELALCQRYYEQWNGTASYTPAGMGLATSATLVSFSWIYKVTKRTAAVSLASSSAAALSPSNGAGGVTVSNVVQITGATQVNDQAMMIQAGVATTPFTIGQASIVYLTNASTNYIAASAEL